MAAAIEGDKIGSNRTKRSRFLPVKLCSAIARAAGSAKTIAKKVTVKAINKLLIKALEIPDEESNKYCHARKLNAGGISAGNRQLAAND